MNKTSDAVISINTNKINERRVFVNFVYNKYSKNETTLNDNIILNKGSFNKWYVDDDGSDDNDGSIENPFKTLKKALSKALFLAKALFF